MEAPTFTEHKGEPASSSNDLASWKRFLNTFVNVYIVIDVILIVLGALFATGVIDADTVLDVYGVGAGQLAGASAAAFATTIGVALVVSYAVNLVCVLVVRRGVKDPAKMKLGMVLFGILPVLALVSLVKALLDGTGLEALTQSVATAVMKLLRVLRHAQAQRLRKVAAAPRHARHREARAAREERAAWAFLMRRADRPRSTTQPQTKGPRRCFNGASW